MKTLNITFFSLIIFLVRGCVETIIGNLYFSAIEFKDLTKFVKLTNLYSSSNPNTQQLPANTEHRQCFVARPGRKFIIADFASQEIAIMAAMSGEKIWLDALQNGGDLHQQTADLIGLDRHTY